MNGDERNADDEPQLTGCRRYSWAKLSGADPEHSRHSCGSQSWSFKAHPPALFPAIPAFPTADYLKPAFSQADAKRDCWDTVPQRPLAQAAALTEHHRCDSSLIQMCDTLTSQLC